MLMLQALVWLTECSVSGEAGAAADHPHFAERPDSSVLLNCPSARGQPLLRL